MKRRVFPNAVSAVGVVLSLVLALAAGGCSDEGVTPKTPDAYPGLAQGSVDPSGGSFAITLPAAGTPQNPILGPFVLHGSNIHYDDALGALVVDLWVANEGRVAHPEPIAFEFIRVLPESVTVLNPDPTFRDAGVTVVFEFENDDGVWTPGEGSLPRPVQFGGVGPGESVAFVGRLLVGNDRARGTIGGFVWNDVNRNGQVDRGEPGQPGVEMFMTIDVGPGVTPPEVLWRTLSGPDGRYRFDGLRAGFYTVTVAPSPEFLPTTPSVIRVVLTELDGAVSEFLHADFGVIPQPIPPRPRLNVGDWVDVSGEYVPDPSNQVAAYRMAVIQCENKPPGDSTGTGGGPGNDVFNPCRDPINDLAGQVTAKDPNRRAFAVMGTWVVFDTTVTDTLPPDSTVQVLGAPEMIDYDRVEVGDRVWVRVWEEPATDRLLGVFIWPWRIREDKVRGYIEAFEPSPADRIEFIRVLRTRIAITPMTEIIISP